MDRIAVPQVLFMSLLSRWEAGGHCLRNFSVSIFFQATRRVVLCADDLFVATLWKWINGKWQTKASILFGLGADLLPHLILHRGHVQWDLPKWLCSFKTTRKETNELNNRKHPDLMTVDGQTVLRSILAGPLRID